MNKADKLEKLIKSIMADAEKDGEPVTREEAKEMAKMEIKAGAIKNYTESTAERKKGREVKKDPTKIAIIKDIENAISLLGFENLKVVNEQRELCFDYKGANYSLTLTKHRPPKEKQA